MSLSFTRTVLCSRSLRFGAQAAARPCRLPLLHNAPSVRTYASKKKKASSNSSDDEEHSKTRVKVSTDSLVPGSKQILAGDVYYKAEDAMKGIADYFRKQVADMEARATGRVTPAMLSPVRVHVSGGDKPARLEEIATVGVRDGTTLMVTVFEDHVRCMLLCTLSADLWRCTDPQGCRDCDLRCETARYNTPANGRPHD